MEKKKLLNLDLQFFAAEEVSEVGENDLEVANQGSDETSESEGEETSANETIGDAEPTAQSDEENARYAAARRRAEEDIKRRYEAQKSADDERIAAMCAGVKHPITGQPITTLADYLDALEIQQKNEREAELRNKGVDPDMVNRMIENNPLVRQAKQVIEKSKETEANMQIIRDVEEISKIDPSIKTMQDIANLPNCDEIIARVERGASLVDAYKAANFDVLLNKRDASARQMAINEMRGKSHLNTPNSVAQTDDSVDVPVDILNRWKSEGKTEKQIKELYNTVIKKLGGK